MRAVFLILLALLAAVPTSLGLEAELLMPSTLVSPTAPGELLSVLLPVVEVPPPPIGKIRAEQLLLPSG